ncbi:TonB-dependent receptor [Povalibacter sp.]|uniref:TonB-dependent receptor plug domain-containing protein n=1 Tax=Povalibacter sp. TaxID=1962978 RepID=UPI002F405397
MSRITLASMKWRVVCVCLCTTQIPLGMAADVSTTESARVELEEIVVTGSRLRRAVAAPATVLDAARIEQLGASTVADLLKFLPQQPYTRGEESRFGGAQFIELRGLGADTTLVLINGRRASVTASNAAFNAFDLNTIPVSAIERIEVLPDAASAVYGADAIGGVVNIILKREIERVEADVRFGAASGGAAERRASLAGGASSDRVKASLVLDWFDRDPLLGEARDRWRNQDYTRFQGVDYRSANANPGNVMSRTAANLPGLTSSRAAVPVDSTGMGLTPADFVATAGQRNLESLARYTSLVPESERKSGMGALDVNITSSLEGFVEALYVDRRQLKQSAPAALSGVLVPGTHPFNPFDVDVSVNFLITGLGPQREIVESESLRLVGGLRGTLGTWDWELSYLDGQEDASSWTENAADPQRVAGALAATDPALALNPFMDGPGGSQSLLDSLRATPVLSRYESDAGQWTGFLRGSLGALPAGPVDVVVGAEHRTEGIVFDSIVFVDHEREVKAGFAEMRIPLIDASMGIAAARLLLMTVAVRQDDYSDFGSTVNPQVTLNWIPAASLVVRATYGTSFRAPSLFELYSPRRSIPGSSIVDAQRGGESAVITVISGGNPDLDPVTARSWSAGVKWSPERVDGLEFGATYWDIQMDERVRIFSQQLVLANEALFPERVVRQAPTTADVAAGWAGALVSVDSSRINFGTLSTSGIDLEASWSLVTALGTFKPSAMVTWVSEFVAGSAPGTPAVDRIDVGNLDGTILDWRVVAGLGWQNGVWGGSVTARYIPSYDDATFTGARTGNQVDAQWLIDAQLSLDFRDEVAGSWLHGFALQLGVANLFDEEPPFARIGDPLGYDLSQGDLRQRFGYINLSKRF